MAKPIQIAEKARADRGERRIVRVRIRVIEGRAGLEIITELDNGDVEDIFNGRDFEDFDELTTIQGKSKANFDKRHNAKLPDAERIIAATERVRADDYPGEPPYLHAGIHLLFRSNDEIEWFSPQKINFRIDVGQDPELALLTNNLPHGQALPKAALHAAALNPFVDQFPKFCVSGKSVNSGPLKNTPALKNQKYYKFSIQVLGTDIAVDPHIDCHDD